MRWNEILAYSFRAMPSGETTTHKVEFLKEKYLMVLTFWGEVGGVCVCVCVCVGGGGSVQQHSLALSAVGLYVQR